MVKPIFNERAVCPRQRVFIGNIDWFRNIFVSLHRTTWPCSRVVPVRCVLPDDKQGGLRRAKYGGVFQRQSSTKRVLGGRVVQTY